MNRMLTVVAALLLIQTNLIHVKVAVAAEINEHNNTKYADENRKLKITPESNSQKKNKAQKIIAMLKVIGFADADTINLVNKIDARTKDGRLMLHQERIANGNLTLRYDLQPRIRAKQLELNYKPDNSHTEYSVRTNAIMVNYKFEF